MACLPIMTSPRSCLFLLVATASAGLFAASCSSSGESADGGSGSPDGGSTSVYVPFIGDFCDYASWTTYVEPDAGGDGIIAKSATTDGGFVHVAGGRIEHINKIPPHGSTEFPVGTIIVKEIPSQDQIFAMAKVGVATTRTSPTAAR